MTSKAQAVLSAVVDRIRFARRAGFQYAGKRDVYEVAGYPSESDLEGRTAYDYYWSRYERQDIAGRLVDMPPAASWRKPPEIVEPEQEDGTEFTEAFAELADRLHLWNRLERADRLARIGRYGVLLVGTADTGTDGDMMQPIGDVGGPDGVLYLSAYSEKHAEVTGWESDPSNPRFGLPSDYQIDLAGGVTNFPSADARVHHSRLIHIAEGKLSDEVFGRPTLKRPFNRLIDLEKVTAATGEAYWQLAVKFLLAKLDAEADISGAELKELGEELEDIQHDLRRQIALKGGSLEWMGGDTPDPSAAADLFIQLIAAAGGIPKRILIGNETGERASSEDQKQWLGSIMERQTSFCEPVILRPLIDLWIRIGALPAPGADGYDVVWPNLFALDEVQLAEVSMKRAQTAQALTAVGSDPYDLVHVDDESVVTLRPSEEVWDERDAEPDDDPMTEPLPDDEADDEVDEPMTEE